LDSFGIVAALEWQTKEFEKRSEISIDFFTNCPDLELDPDTSIVLFRIFQETLTNVSKYAEAHLVNASVELENENLVMRIRDDGKGFIVSEIEHKETLGIMGMQERALMIGADYKINSSPGKGTATEVIFPLQKN
jgi:signal transduction histidine kinase